MGDSAVGERPPALRIPGRVSTGRDCSFEWIFRRIGRKTRRSGISRNLETHPNPILPVCLWNDGMPSPDVRGWLRRWEAVGKGNLPVFPALGFLPCDKESAALRAERKGRRRRANADLLRGRLFSRHGRAPAFREDPLIRLFAGKTALSDPTRNGEKRAFLPKPDREKPHPRRRFGKAGRIRDLAGKPRLSR